MSSRLRAVLAALLAAVGLIAVAPAPAQAFLPGWNGKYTWSCAHGAINTYSAYDSVRGQEITFSGWIQPCNVPAFFSGGYFGYRLQTTAGVTGNPTGQYQSRSAPTPYRISLGRSDWTDVTGVCLTNLPGAAQGIACLSVSLDAAGKIVLAPVAPNDPRFAGSWVGDDLESWQGDPDCIACP